MSGKGSRKTKRGEEAAADQRAIAKPMPGVRRFMYGEWGTGELAMCQTYPEW